MIKMNLEIQIGIKDLDLEEEIIMIIIETIEGIIMAVETIEIKIIIEGIEGDN